MKNIFQTFVLVAVTVLTSCDNKVPKRNELICGVKDPIIDLKWLNEEFKNFIGGPKLDGIILYKYNNQHIIEVQNSLSSSTNIHQYYCDGTKLNLEDPEAFADFRNNANEVKILYGINLWKQLNL